MRGLEPGRTAAAPAQGELCSIGRNRKDYLTLHFAGCVLWEIIMWRRPWRSQCDVRDKLVLG
jgi:hypothetical protein